MTDARVPEAWLNDRRVQRLSDPAFRLFILALTWSVSNRTDGLIDPDDVRLVPGVEPGYAAELERSGLWERQKDSWLIVDFARTQTSRHQLEVMEDARRKEREKKARQRASRAAVPLGRPRRTTPGKSPGTSPGTPPGDVARDGTG